MKRRSPLLFAPLTLQFLWFLALIDFPATWRDREGYNGLTALMGLSAALGVVGLALLVAAGFGKVSWYFAGVVVAAPVCHLADTASPEWLSLFFWLLSFVGLFAATVLEMQSPADGK